LDPEVSKQLQIQGAEPAPLGHTELAAFIERDIARWKVIIKDRNIRAE